MVSVRQRLELHHCSFQGTHIHTLLNHFFWIVLYVETIHVLLHSFFHHIKKLQLNLRNFMTLRDSMY